MDVYLWAISSQAGAIVLVAVLVHWRLIRSVGTVVLLVRFVGMGIHALPPTLVSLTPMTTVAAKAGGKAGGKGGPNGGLAHGLSGPHAVDFSQMLPKSEP